MIELDNLEKEIKEKIHLLNIKKEHHKKNVIKTKKIDNYFNSNNVKIMSNKKK